jgi:hypothetical protein
MQQNASIATNFIQTVPKLNAGNLRKMQPNSLLTGNPPSQVDGGAGTSVTTETQKSKVKSVDTHVNAANYWAPLINDDDNDDNDKNFQRYPTEQQIEHGSTLLTKPPQHHTRCKADLKHSCCKWLQERCGIKLVPKTKTKEMVLDSGATSHFV